MTKLAAQVEDGVPVVFGRDADLADDLTWWGAPILVADDSGCRLSLSDTIEAPGDAHIDYASFDGAITVADVTFAVAPRTSLSENNFLQVSMSSAEIDSDSAYHVFSARLFAVKRQTCLQVEVVSHKWHTLAVPVPIGLYDDADLQNVRVRLMVSDADGSTATFSVYVATSPTADYELFWRRRRLPCAGDMDMAVLSCHYTKSNASGHFFFRDLAISRRQCSSSDHVLPIFGSLVVNEVMPLPLDGRSDFFEVHNASPDSVPLSDLLFVYSSAGYVYREFALSSDPSFIPPGGYAVVARYPDFVMSSFGISDAHGGVGIPLLASDGRFSVQDFYANVYDSVVYSSSWHSPVLANQHNVSLERLSPSADGCSPSSWASAAASAGYATPGAPNSRGTSDSNTSSASPSVSVVADVFIPDGGGVRAPACAEVLFSAEGDWTVSMRVFSPTGFLVSTPVDGKPAALAERLLWNGRDASGSLVTPGAYVLLVSAWSVDGRVFRKRIVVTLSVP